MILHLSFELPNPEPPLLNAEIPDLTSEEVRILKRQIRGNTCLVEDYVMRLDLLVNKEGYQRGAIFVEKIRRRLELLMEENDTFRKVLWKHYQAGTF